MKKTLGGTLALFALASLSAALVHGPAARRAAAQDPVGPFQQEMGPAGAFVIRNARVVTVSGPVIENGAVAVSNGRITAVGATVNAPAGARVIDARGLTVFPGMIDAGTNMGLVEISSGAPGTVDTQELGDMNPNAQAVVAVNPHSAHIDVTRVAGVTSVLTLPSGGTVSGQAALINLAGTSQREMAVVPHLALVMTYPALGGGGFGGQQPGAPDATTARDRRVEELRRVLRDAEAYGRAAEAHAKDPKNVPRPRTDLKLSALAPYARGQRPVIFRADRERDIRNSIRFAEEMKLRPIILGGSDAWRVATLLKEKDVPVIIDSTLNLPLREDDPYDAHFENAARLQRAGVRFCISTGDGGAHVRDLGFHAGMAAAFGLPRDEALRAVTLYPAQILGVAEQMGTIEAGKVANLVVADGDLLEARTNVRHLFIAGREIPLVSRHTVLYDHFRQRP